MILLTVISMTSIYCNLFWSYKVDEKLSIVLGEIGKLSDKIDRVPLLLGSIGERVAKLESSHEYLRSSIDDLKPAKPVKISIPGMSPSTKKIIYAVVALAGTIATILGGISLQ